MRFAHTVEVRHLFASFALLGALVAFPALALAQEDPSLEDSLTELAQSDLATDAGESAATLPEAAPASDESFVSGELSLAGGQVLEKDFDSTSQVGENQVPQEGQDDSQTGFWEDGDDCIEGQGDLTQDDVWGAEEEQEAQNAQTSEGAEDLSDIAVPVSDSSDTLQLLSPDAGAAPLEADAAGSSPGERSHAAAMSAAVSEALVSPGNAVETLTKAPSATQPAQVLQPAVPQVKAPSSSPSSGSEAQASAEGKGSSSSRGTGAWKRVWGDTALDTMAAVAQEGWKASDAVIVATDANFPDALSASSLAGALHAPILLTNPNYLSDQAKEEIVRLKAQFAYIIGGKIAVAEAVERQIREAGCKNVERVWGNSASDTAVAVARKLAQIKESAAVSDDVSSQTSQPGSLAVLGGTAFVATDAAYQDALAISPYAYKNCAPIFLATKMGTMLSDSTIEALVEGGFDHVVVVGGNIAISEEVVDQIYETGIDEVERVWGANAEATSAKVAVWSLDKGMDAAHVGVATSLDYRDALTGAALCGSLNSPLVLAKDSNRNAIYSFVNAKRSSLDLGYIFGGHFAVTEATKALIESGETRTAYANLEGVDSAGFTKLGIDVSQWQGSIDWQKVKDSGIDYAIIRVGYGANEASKDDIRYLENIAGARAVGLPIGVYLYSYAGKEKEAIDEAEHVLRTLKSAGVGPSDLAYGIYYDLEEGSMEKASNRSLLLNMTKAFCSRLEDDGFTNVGVYANLNWWTHYLPSDEYDQWNRWVAQYNDSCYYEGEYCMWQFTSKGVVDGITENTVDMNLYYR